MLRKFLSKESTTEKRPEALKNEKPGRRDPIFPFHVSVGMPDREALILVAEKGRTQADA